MNQARHCPIQASSHSSTDRYGSSMDLKESVALVTGANRGLGARLVQELLRAGAAKVYATSRTPGAVAADVAADPRVVTLTLDITDAGSVQQAAKAAKDVTVL